MAHTSNSATECSSFALLSACELENQESFPILSQWHHLMYEIIPGFPEVIKLSNGELLTQIVLTTIG